MKNNHAKIVFLYLLSLISLGFVAVNLGNLIFQIINKNIIDIVEAFASQYSPGALRFAIAALITATPIYFVSTWQINKNLSKGDLAGDSAVRRWLSYLILLISAIVALGYLIAIIFNFLDGELTLKFGLKALTALIISGTVFSYYLYDIKLENREGGKNKIIKIYFYISLSVIVISLIISFFFVESPAEARRQRHDRAVIEKFQQVDSAVFSYFEEKGKLPVDLENLVEASRFLVTDDLINPVDNKKFDYKIITDKKYAICSTFQTVSQDELDQIQYGYADKRWSHGAGYQCLEQTVDVSELQKPILFR